MDAMAEGIEVDVVNQALGAVFVLRVDGVAMAAVTALIPVVENQIPVHLGVVRTVPDPDTGCIVNNVVDELHVRAEDV